MLKDAKKMRKRTIFFNFEVLPLSVCSFFRNFAEKLDVWEIRRLVVWEKKQVPLICETANNRNSK